ncbi:uncharacterized protein [Lepeophtheirus salmonis]|uniref:uncharacterized protein n=1 Tax=Lepeophtheirus salmonis TaxID=72036 RepID=UPI001AE8608F|nr:myristoylated alanine-rich C-kinase substrate-like [Lepeophtheirus salmonis]
MNINQEVLICCIVLGAAALIKSDPVPSGYEGYGEKSLGLSRYDQEYSSPYGSKRDFDEGHKEDIEQESIKYHSLVNKALNTAKDADRFVGDSIKEQEKSQKDHIRYKRSVVPLGSTAKRTFKPFPPQGVVPAAAAVESAPGVAAPVAGLPQTEPVAVAEPALIAPQPIQRQQAPVAAPVAEMQVENTLPQVAATKEKTPEYEDEEGEEPVPTEPKGEMAPGGQGEIDPGKIDEMIDLMNSLNQKFAKMIANWDEYAANHETGGGEAGASMDADSGAGEGMGETKRKPAKPKKKAPKQPEEETEYEAPEEEGEEPAAGSGAAALSVGATKMKRAKKFPQLL